MTPHKAIHSGSLSFVWERISKQKSTIFETFSQELLRERRSEVIYYFMHRQVEETWNLTVNLDQNGWQSISKLTIRSLRM